MNQTVETKSVVVERSFPHPPAKLWRAISESDLLARWMMPNDFVPEVGRKFAFRTEPVAHWDGVVQCEVLEIEPPRRLVLRWGVGQGELVTVVEFTVSPDGSGSRLRLEQSGFTEAQEMNRRGAQLGLNRMVDNLPTVLDGIA